MKYNVMSINKSNPKKPRKGFVIRDKTLLVNSKYQRPKIKYCLFPLPDPGKKGMGR
jgi:hypothetical protein